MSLENFDDIIHEGSPDEICGELTRASAVRDFGHLAMAGHDGLSGDVILTIIAFPDADDERFTGYPQPSS